MTALLDLLRQRIAATGPIGVAEYMELCLHHPEHGYYRHRDAIGRAGDFITAPEISQIFGELIGLWCAAVWDQMGRPAPFDLIELGPGRGTLMADALRAMRVMPAALDAARLVLVETSAVLRGVQQATLTSVSTHVRWTTLDDLRPVSSAAIVIANEFLDTFPVAQFVYGGGVWRRRSVGLDGTGALTWVDGPTDRSAEIGLDPGPPDGSIREVQTWSPLLAALERLSGHGPMAGLFVDYGYSGPALGDTLQAVRDHAFCGVFNVPGEADLSCQVDFRAFARAARALPRPLHCDGPVSQGQFLGRLGAVERASRLMSSNPSRALEIEQGVARLLSPTGMGHRFQVLGLRTAGVPALPGF